ncbi:MAG: META domain-containing protein [Planctomycetaceae bacterium]|jgi:heat shock protein HslJ|nr:META domain-containing protein [Phycisphaerales bacterium]MCE2653398.1 META domain-containing protein [Planctomycetaceae bacterium]
MRLTQVTAAGLMLVVAGGLVMGTLGGCATTGGGQSEAGVRSRLAGEWTLKSVDGRAVSLPAGGGERGGPTLQFDEGFSRAAGLAGVNRYSAALDATGLDQGKLKFGPAIATRMAGPPELMRLETDFLGMLDKVDGWTLSQDGRTLTLTAGGKAGLVFSR